MSVAVKKKPIRTCLGCGEAKEKKSLIRVLRTPEGEIVIDPTGKRSGRGAYICPDPKCLEKARKSRRIEKNLSCEIPDEVYSKLASQLADVESGVDGSDG